MPIRYPRDYRVTLRGIADKDEVPFAVELVVNGYSAGTVEATPRWQDYEFEVKMSHLRPGFNEFELRFFAQNDTPDRRLELAINLLELTSARD